MRRFEAYVQNPSSLDADLRDSVLEIIAEHADAKDWDQLHALAKAAKSSLEKQDLFVRLGYVHDPALARRALQLALGDEAPLTVRPAIVRAVSVHFSGLAVDFAIAHADVLAVSLEPDSRAQFVPRLASNANDPAMIATLRAYAAAHIPASAQGDVVKAAAAISYKAEIRRKSPAGHRPLAGGASGLTCGGLPVRRLRCVLRGLSCRAGRNANEHHEAAAYGAGRGRLGRGHDFRMV